MWVSLKIARVSMNNSETYGIVDSKNEKLLLKKEIEKKFDVKLPNRVEDFLSKNEGKHLELVRGLENKFEYFHQIKEFRLLPPIKDSYKIICLAFNYLDQDTWLRFGKEPPKEPVISLKPRTSLTGPYCDIICPPFVKQLDYEGELALVIGSRCKQVDKCHTMSNISGYFIMNDVSSRHIQFIDHQYGRAKGFDTFGPCGPWVTTTDEISDPDNLKLVTKVNGEVRQDSSTKNLVLKIEEIIEKISQIMTLEPGDIISTGTPSGTALSLSATKGDKYLKHDDVVEVEIEKLGTLKNKVRIEN